ncbi:STN domain-containing protein [Sphingobacterium sp. MYb382]|uniref:STN domain-containing protein n=1 Tax=Sphingobacterium sp. MYb382 TaxID=2745278 RepID=UPI0030B2D675
MNFYQIMRVMKITMVIITCFLVQVSASTYAQRVTMNLKNSPIHVVLEEIRKQTKYDFSYDVNVFKNAQPVNVNVKAATIEQVLKACFLNQPFTYIIKAESSFYFAR